MKKEITENFKVLGNQEGKHQVAGFGVVDLDNITLEEATDLHRAGCPIFVKKHKEVVKEDKPAEAVKKA